MGSGAWGFVAVQSCEAVTGHTDEQPAELALEGLWDLAVAVVALGACHRLVAVTAHVERIFLKGTLNFWYAQTPKKKPLHVSAEACLFGSSTWARTRDLRINSPALYRLSYRGIASNYRVILGLF
jgi:hypothetical protein